MGAQKGTGHGQTEGGRTEYLTSEGRQHAAESRTNPGCREEDGVRPESGQQEKGVRPKEDGTHAEDDREQEDGVCPKNGSQESETSRAGRKEAGDANRSEDRGAGRQEDRSFRKEDRPACGANTESKR